MKWLEIGFLLDHKYKLNRTEQNIVRFFSALIFTLVRL